MDPIDMLAAEIERRDNTELTQSKETKAMIKQLQTLRYLRGKTTNGTP